MYDNKRRAFIAVAGTKEICLEPGMANRHGLITGATGTGKTVTLQTLAETFSQMGVPVFAADIKGDLSGIGAPGGGKEGVDKRIADLRLADSGFAYQGFPVEFWDVLGEAGVPVRAVVSDMGPLLLSRLLSLNDTQEGVLTVVFKLASDESLGILDLKDLQKLLAYAAGNTSAISASYGNISGASIGAIQRGLLALEEAGAGRFFGEPDLAMEDLMQVRGGQGVVNILAADKLMQSPKVYSAFLLWLLNKLYQTLPEVGDRDRPALVLFFDEAHLLFSEAPKALLDKVEQVVRLIRSKGVGVWFISQNPADMPDAILGQLGNRVQHALRAYTPADRKGLKAAAQSFRPNPAFDTQTAIAELATGEALVSFLDEHGAPHAVERALIVPPQSHIGPLSQDERQRYIAASVMNKHYAVARDRTSAFEILSERLNAANSQTERAAEAKADQKARREEEKRQQADQRRVQKEEAQSRKFWGSVAKSVLVPAAKQFINALFKGSRG